MGADDSYTIDQLAAAAGMTVRNVRSYATRGLLQAPERQGRASTYRAEHLHRLEQVTVLKAAGMPLQMIGTVVRTVGDLSMVIPVWAALTKGALSPAISLTDGPAGGSDSSAGGSGSPGGRAAADGHGVLVPAGEPSSAAMRDLAGLGLPATAVLLIALQAARVGIALARDLAEILEGERGAGAAALSCAADLTASIVRDSLTTALGNA
jgi:DNA-binding transcriptional MerR regulator